MIPVVSPQLSDSLSRFGWLKPQRCRLIAEAHKPENWDYIKDKDIAAYQIEANLALIPESSHEDLFCFLMLKEVERPETASGVVIKFDKFVSSRTPSLSLLPIPFLKHIHLSQRIDSFGYLRDGWNGIRSKAIRREVIQRAKDILVDILLSIPDNSAGLLQYFEVFATSKGGIQFECGTGSREVEIEYSPDDLQLALLKEDRSSGVEEMWEESIQPSEIANVTSWLLNC